MGSFFTGRNAAAETAGLRSKPSDCGKFSVRQKRAEKAGAALAVSQWVLEGMGSITTELPSPSRSRIRVDPLKKTVRAEAGPVLGGAVFYPLSKTKEVLLFCREFAETLRLRPTNNFALPFQELAHTHPTLLNQVSDCERN